MDYGTSPLAFDAVHFVSDEGILAFADGERFAIQVRSDVISGTGPTIHVSPVPTELRATFYAMPV